MTTLRSVMEQREPDYEISCDICGEEVPESETDGYTCEDCLERAHERQERP